MILCIVFQANEKGQELYKKLSTLPNGTCTSSHRSIQIYTSWHRQHQIVHQANHRNVMLVYLDRGVIDQYYGGLNGCIFRDKDAIVSCTFLTDKSDVDVPAIYEQATFAQQQVDDLFLEECQKAQEDSGYDDLPPLIDFRDPYEPFTNGQTSV
jgi:hypothetical protein